MENEIIEEINKITEDIDRRNKIIRDTTELLNVTKKYFDEHPDNKYLFKNADEIISNLDTVISTHKFSLSMLKLRLEVMNSALKKVADQ